jgi:hypothetical protein
VDPQSLLVSGRSAVRIRPPAPRERKPIVLLAAETQVTTLARKRIYLVIESGKVILLVFVVARCVWKGFDLASGATVNGLAQRVLFGSLPPRTT